MTKLKEIDERQYKVDFMISERYISFSSELLRLSLLIMGAFGTAVLSIIKVPGDQHFLNEPIFFIISMVFFACCVISSLFHRYFASDTMSWFIAWLRAEEEGKSEKSITERTGFHKLLKRSEYSLITSEWLFGGGVLFFIFAIFYLILSS